MDAFLTFIEKIQMYYLKVDEGKDNLLCTTEQQLKMFKNTIFRLKRNFKIKLVIFIIKIFDYL